MLAVVGTVPVEGFPLVAGHAQIKGDNLVIENHAVPINRGTPALIASAIRTGQGLALNDPFCYLAGDIGRGAGSRHLYEYLAQDLTKRHFTTVTFHYLQPDIEWQSRVVSMIKKRDPTPVLIADAGFMYGAKMAGLSEDFALFTPDLGELAFLADEEAPHPFYTRGFILHEEDHVPDLISRAYEHRNAARRLLVKGSKDYIASREGVLSVVDGPVEEAMEVIGGTGDTLTGIVSALISSGMEVAEASTIAARVNRVAGSYAKPTPATQVMEIIRCIPEALEICMRKHNG
jgi:sugar/nucleoside kinase (ribokinase family)